MHVLHDACMHDACIHEGLNKVIRLHACVCTCVYAYIYVGSLDASKSRISRPTFQRVTQLIISAIILL